MSDLFLETNLAPSVVNESEKQGNPCFECGNCCSNIYESIPLKDILYFIRRGYTPHICKDQYEYESVRDYPQPYPANLYIFNENLGESLKIFLEGFEQLAEEDKEICKWLEIKFGIVGECINHDPQTNLCTDYGNRPDMCREFKPGSIYCNNIRENSNLSVIPLTEIADDHMMIK